MKGTRLPKGVEVRSLYHPAMGCTRAATIIPAKPNPPRKVFLAPDGASSRIRLGIMTASMARNMPVMPKPKAARPVKDGMVQAWGALGSA